MKLKIAVLPGDGIGPEVTNQSIKVLNCIADKYNHKVELTEGLVGAIAIDVTQTHSVKLQLHGIAVQKNLKQEDLTLIKQLLQLKQLRKC